MEANISRRALLAGSGCVAAGSLVGQQLSVARAQEATQARQGQSDGICLSMVFEDGVKLKFDSEHYVSNHLPLLRDIYGDNVGRIELCAAAAREGPLILVPLMAGIPVPRAITTLWIRDVAAFGQRLAANADRINKDLGTVSNGNRVAQPNRVGLELGAPRSEIAPNTEVFSMHFRQYIPLTGKASGPAAKKIQETRCARAAPPPCARSVRQACGRRSRTPA